MSAPAIDPAIALVARASLALLFARAAVHKVRDAPAFRSALAGYRLLPGNWAAPAAYALVALEVAVSVGLCLTALTRPAAVAAAGLLLLYAAAIGANLLRGIRDIDCGCTGAAREQPLSIRLVVRNGLLASVAVAVALPVTGRALTWVDATTVVAGVSAAALLYAALEGLLAGAERSAALSRRVLEARHA
jgi:uncharacterized membrane protein YphA (DoxX/SURF4 family)